VAGSKSYTTKSPKLNLAGNNFFFLVESQRKIKIFFSQKYLNIMYFSTFEALIHSIWTHNEKVMDNLVFWAI